MKATVLGISELKYKRGEELRYVKIHTDEGDFLVRMTDHSFETLPCHQDGTKMGLIPGQQIIIDSFDMDRKQKDKPYIWQFQDGTVMMFNPKVVTIMEHEKITSIQKYFLSNIWFYDWGVVMDNGKSKCTLSKEVWDNLTGIETSISLNRVKGKIKKNSQSSAYIELQANFKVYYKWSLNNKKLYYNNGGQIILIKENLEEIRKVVILEEEVTRTRLLLEEIKLMLQNKMFLTIEDITILARKYTMPEQDVDEYIRSTVWKKNYDEQFTEYLKSKASSVLYGDEGLFYVIGQITVLEVPEPGKATYVFIGTPTKVASSIEAIRTENFENTFELGDGYNTRYGSKAWREILYRLKKSDPVKLSWFVGRIVHHDLEQWKKDLDTVLTQAKSQALNVSKKIPANPKMRRSTITQFIKEPKFAIEFFVCGECGHYPVTVHVEIPSKKPVQGNKRACHKCGSTNLVWGKVREANKDGKVTE